MARDVWITDYTPQNGWYGAGVGGFMARKALAEATFGADRVLVIDDIPALGTQDKIEYFDAIASRLFELMKKHGVPEFFISGWQDPHGYEVEEFISKHGASVFGLRPTLISVGNADVDSVDVIITSYSTPAVDDPKFMRMAGVPHNVNDKTLAATRGAARYVLPAEIQENDFVTLLVGETQEQYRKEGRNTRPDCFNGGQELIRTIAEFCDDKGLNLVVVTSPRTTPETIRGLYYGMDSYESAGGRQRIHIHEYTDFSDKANIYPGILGLSNNKLVVVTEDSASMICEAVASPVPATVWSPWRQLQDYNEVLIESFDARGFTSPFETVKESGPKDWAKGKIVFNTNTETALRLSRKLVERGLAEEAELPLLRPSGPPSGHAGFDLK